MSDVPGGHIELVVLTCSYEHVSSLPVEVEHPRASDGVRQTTTDSPWPSRGKHETRQTVGRDLDGFNRPASNYGGGKVWGRRNFDYDSGGNVNLDDYNLMAGNFNSTGLGFSSGYGGTGGYSYDELLDNLLNGGGALKAR